MKNIVILISGGGSNMAAIIRTAQQQDWAGRHGIRVAAVLSNKADARGLALAREQGIATEVLDHKAYPSREAFDAALAQAIDAHDPALVVLAGFMRILTPGFVAHFAGRLVNIHPSLLPAFTGLHTHQRAIDAGCRFAGATVHEVLASARPMLVNFLLPGQEEGNARLLEKLGGGRHVPDARALAVQGELRLVGRLADIAGRIDVGDVVRGDAQVHLGRIQPRRRRLQHGRQ